MLSNAVGREAGLTGVAPDGRGDFAARPRVNADSLGQRTLNNATLSH